VPFAHAAWYRGVPPWGVNSRKVHPAAAARQFKRALGFFSTQEKEEKQNHAKER
jgi:hypothetical protein